MSHECRDHYAGKAILMAFWRQRGLQAFCEAGCDVLARKIQAGQLEEIFSEYERTTRNVLRNYQRNRAAACGRAKFLIVVPDEKMRAAVRYKLNLYLPSDVARKAGVAPLSGITRHLK